MTIRKQEFYEGAALHMLTRSGTVERLRYDPPFFLMNDRVIVLMKYTTKNRSPWGFTFTADEQNRLAEQSVTFEAVVALVCGADGVVAFPYHEFQSIAASRQSPVHVSCYRKHGEYYEVNGPDGSLARKVPPLAWRRILGPVSAQ